MPRQNNFDGVVTGANAGPSMHSPWTSEEITSGSTPTASIARAVANATEPMPCPMSKITPRARVASTQGITRPWASQGMLGKGWKAWVSTSPGRSMPTTSS